MKLRYSTLIAAVGMLIAMPAAAQETYENTKLVDKDLNGTARYVGMGGAMEALGADISTISTNPAGIGLFRRSYVGGSFGMVSQQDAKDFATGNKTNASFDQLGFVYSFRSGRKSFMNFAFNYHKSRNFDQILSAANKALGGASQNKLTYIKLRSGLLYPLDKNGLPNDAKGNALITNNQADYLIYNSMTKYVYPDGKADFGYYDASLYTFDRASKGYIGEYDFNLSGNINDRVYLGLTVGLHDVHYKDYSEYTDYLTPNQDNVSQLTLQDRREITGTGVDLKGGVIFRPVESSPFRIGLYVSTPTWYDLTTKNYTTLTDGQSAASNGESYDFKVYTPWTFGASLGHTIGNYLALGATYEFADYGSMDTRLIDGSYYDDYGYSYDETSSDENMNRNTKDVLRGVSTLKVGAEFKAMPELAIRLGYNYVSPMYQKNGYKDGTIDSEGSYYASTTDYTNWKSTNRITVGFGYQIGKMNLDLAYQYSQTNGDFHPFMDSWGDFTNADGSKESIDNFADAVKVKFKRHQLLFTVGYRF